MASITHHIPTFSKFGGLICGRGGQKIKSIKKMFALQRVFLSRGEEGVSTLEITGLPPFVDAAENWLTKKYPNAFLKTDAILHIDLAKENFLKQREMRKSSQLLPKPPQPPIKIITERKIKEKVVSPVKYFNLERYITS